MRRDGFVLVAVLSMAFLIAVLLAISSTFAVSSRRAVADEAKKIPALYLSNAGIERTYARMYSYVQTIPASSGTVGAITNTSSLAVISDAIFNNVLKNPADNSHTAENSLNSGNLGGGTYTITAVNHNAGDTTFTIKSTALIGTTKRVISSKYSVLQSILSANAGSAIQSTSYLVDTANATITGSNAGLVSGSNFAIVCPTISSSNQTCVSAGSPSVYTINTAASNAPAIGSYVTYDNSNANATALQYIRYQVTGKSLMADGSVNLNLTAINEYSKSSTTVTPLTNGAKLAQTTSAASLLSYGTNPATQTPNAAASCTSYVCSMSNIPTQQLFQYVFGITVDQFKKDLLGTATPPSTDSCTAVRYAVYSGNNFDLANGCGSTPRVLIIDSSASNSDVNIKNSNSPFTGVMFILANGQVKFAGNGQIKGALFVDNGTCTPANNNPSSACLSMNGTGGNNHTTSICPSGVKVCYDASTVSGLINTLKSNLTSSGKPRLRELSAWSEIQ